MRVLVILFCNLAYYINPDGSIQRASGWDSNMCESLRSSDDPKLGDPDFYWQDGKIHRGGDRVSCVKR